MRAWALRPAMNRTVLIALLVGAVALAGCASNDTSPSTSTPASSTPASSTPASSTPLVTTPSTPTVPTTPLTGATITAVEVVSAPERVEPGAMAYVCWRVEGSGHVPHVAVHWDTASHPNATTFAAYTGGAMYPNDKSAPDAAGYDLPATFCTNVTAPSTSGMVYFRGHALNPPALPGTLSPEHSFAVGNASSVHFVGDVAEVAPAGTNVTVCWTVAGATEHVPHTAIHFDTTSHPNSTAFSDYKGGAVYPDNGTTAAAAGYDLPGPFCANLAMPASGTLYFRAHVLGGSFANPGNLSEEQSIDVGSPVSIVSLPLHAAAGASVPVCWRVDAPGVHVPHTAVHWDTASHPTATTFADYKGGATYPGGATSAASAGYDLPGPFCSTLTMPASGTLYLRGHVLGGPFGTPGDLTPEASVTSS
ncbi:MAG: hypothetical protein QOE90_110 [Thermoplasmata archaeon]|jgi:hypothetical protein|nr:hypothetical protein [Thermoplasmata archaeon]